MSMREADTSAIGRLDGDGFLPLLGAVEGDVLEAGPVGDDVLDVVGDHDAEVVVRRVGAGVLPRAGPHGAVVGRDGHIVQGLTQRSEGMYGFGVEALHSADLVS